MPQTPAEQKAIVQRMIEAGESEENIATVIRHFEGLKQPPIIGRRPDGSPIYGTTTEGVEHPQTLPGQLTDTAMNTIGNAATTVVQPIAHPLDFLSGIVRMPGQVIQSHMAESQRAFEAFQRGDRTEGTLRALASIVPVVGPMVSAYVDADQSGKEQIAGGMIGGIVQSTIPAMVAGRTVVPSFRRGMNPDDARAIDAARSSGVPVSAGVATGNRALQGMTQVAEKTTATGAGFVNRARLASDIALEGMGQKLASEANTGGPRLSLAQAGQATTQALTKTINAKNAQAERAYSIVEKRSWRPGQQTLTPVGSVPLSVVRAAVRPMYNHLVAVNQATGGLDAGSLAGQTKAFLDSFMGSTTDRVPVLVAERVLGNLKEALRSQSNQFGVSSGQLKMTIRSLQGTIDSAVKADPQAWAALQEGRLATVQKYQAVSLLDKVAGKDRMRSPITASEQLLSDAGVKQIQRLATQSPESVRNLGRAWWEEKFNEARADNRFDLGTASREWRQMSLDTKRIVFKDAIQKDATYLQRVDDFFTAARRIQENLNPSGTAAASANYLKLALAPFEAAVGGRAGRAAAAGSVAQDLASNAFVRAMNNPRVVQLLIDGMKIPASATAQRAANVAAIQTILKAGLPNPGGRQGGPGGPQ